MEVIHLQELRHNNLQDHQELDLTPEDARILYGVAAKGLATAINSHHIQIAQTFEKFVDYYGDLAGVYESDDHAQTAPMSLRAIADHKPYREAS